jgi:alkyl-hydroperoxide reductase/thiol specific antioxidant family protein
LRDALPDIRRRGAELIIVGNGQPQHAIDFRDTEHVESPLYVDPELQAYAAAGLKRGLRSSLSPGVILRGVRAFREGKRQSAPKGDAWQQGGVFVILPGNRVEFVYISEEAGDHPSAEAILSAFDKIGRKKSGASRRR